MLFETIKVVQLSMCVIMGIHDCPNIKQVEMENEWTPAYYYYSDGEAHIHFSNGKPMKEVDQATYLGGEKMKARADGQNVTIESIKHSLHVTN